MKKNEALIEQAYQEARKAFLLYEPYDKQVEFHDYGYDKRERTLSAGNQLGKTTSAAYETAFHLTGVYPEWWDGKRFNKPTIGWASSVTTESTRDNAQFKLFGDISKIGQEGILHSDYIVDYSKARGIPDMLDTIHIKHVSGRTSILQFKSYEKGREKWQGPSLNFVWFDEEPPMKIYLEGLSRTNATQGIVYLTFTPLLGMSDVVMRFWKEKHEQRSLTLMGIQDAKHIPDDQKEVIISSYPPHERKARVEGIPMLGSGRAFPVAREAIEKPTPEIPSHWPRIAGIDIGWDHPTAVVWMAWDRDADIIWIYDCYRASETSVMMHAGVIRSREDWIPISWPHDALQHDKGSGEQIAEQYRDQGVNMLPERATFEDGSNGVEAGVYEMLDRMQTGRLRVAPHLDEWFEEFELYHRENGKLVKIRDDLLSATRYAMMMLRHAETEPKDDGFVDESFDQTTYDRNKVGGY